MSMKVTKVNGSVDEKNGLEYTVGDKFPRSPVYDD